MRFGLLCLPLIVPALTAHAQTFTDVSNLLPRVPNRSAGATVADIDGDGRFDLIAEKEVFRQTASGFEIVRLESGDNQLGTLVADYDGDGQSELALLEALNPMLARYNPARATIETTADLPPVPIGLTQGSLWLDYEGDGHLDLFLGDDTGPDFIYRNQGDGTFAIVGASVLPALDEGTYGAAAADYDRDGNPDIYIGICAAQDEPENLLYRNGGVSFEEAAEAAGVDDSGSSWGVVWLDYDYDGWLDLFVANMQASGSALETLYHNEGDGTFTDVTEEAGVAGGAEEDSWSAAAADYDNDGWLDLFVANEPQTIRLYRNNTDGTFTDIAEKAGLGDLATFRIAVGDINRDGWIDLFPRDDSGAQGKLFFNDGGSNGWLSVDLSGVASTRDGIGARVEVTTGDLSMVREITAGDGFMSQSHGLRAHFGLGTATSADVTVRWPSGQVDVVEGVAANQEITIVEGVGTNAPPAMFALTALADGAVVPLGEPVTLQWETATDADAVTYTVHLAAPDGTDATLETTATTLEVPASALVTEGPYRWAVVARDAYSARTSLDNATFTNNPNVASEPPPTLHPLRVEVWPNPTRASPTVRFELAEPERVTLEVFDALGRRVQEMSLGTPSAGSHEERLELNGLGTGVFVVRLTGSRSGAATARFARVE